MDKFLFLAIRIGVENTAYDSVFGIIAGRHPPPPFPFRKERKSAYFGEGWATVLHIASHRSHHIATYLSPMPPISH
jgi:hypothetical protein